MLQNIKFGSFSSRAFCAEGGAPKARTTIFTLGKRSRMATTIFSRASTVPRMGSALCSFLSQFFFSLAASSKWRQPPI